MCRTAALHYRQHILFVNMFIAMGTVTETYNHIMTLLSTPFYQLLQEYWCYTGEPAPKFTRETDKYFTISGIMGYLALSSAPQRAREETITQVQPVVDDLFKQLVTLEPYNKGLLYTLGLDLTPSPGVTQSIQHKLREN